jgi:L-ribulose-5-phosphate 4-epimerase
MKYARLRRDVCEANKEVGRSGLAVLTWGNASGVDREAGVMAIKPSGISYADLVPENIVLVHLETGGLVDGMKRPSSDTPTHLHLYRKFASIGGIVHSHSHFTTVWAQAGREIPCYGTTHADLFYGPVPITRELTREEVGGEYELNTGKVIVEHFETAGLDVARNPGVLVRGHGPFAWGDSAAAAIGHAVAMEEVARMAYHCVALNPALGPVPDYLLDKHFLRKHGATAYYGQP